MAVNPKCIQCFDPGEHELCKNGAVCATCGWNKDENKRRMEMIAKIGLTLGGDGINRLILKR